MKTLTKHENQVMRFALSRHIQILKEAIERWSKEGCDMLEQKEDLKVSQELLKDLEESEP